MQNEKQSEDSYFERFGFCPRQIEASAQTDLGLVVVIPCFNEPDLMGSLESLWRCERPACSVEVIVVINSSEASGPEILFQNQLTFRQASDWIAGHEDARLRIHLLHFPALPAKQAGVGLARKIGMDEATRRFDAAGHADGIVVCYDADCRCDPNYLASIERHFGTNLRSPGCSIYFEHPLAGLLDPKVAEAIAAYELHLRYYVQALRYAGFPYAHHTIGSCMAVRADIYKKQGGMNKRQAGEDFYFLQKIIPLGGFTDLTATRVMPSPRSSDRVPFGTGKAVHSYLEGGAIVTDPLQAFLDLKTFFNALALCRKEILSTRLAAAQPESIGTFLQAQGFAKALQEIHENTSTELAFRKRLFHWFNAFMVMKFVHHARDHFYGQPKVEEEASRLLELLSGFNGQPANPTTLDLLHVYRRLERK